MEECEKASGLESELPFVLYRPYTGGGGESLVRDAVVRAVRARSDGHGAWPGEDETNVSSALAWQ